MAQADSIWRQGTWNVCRGLIRFDLFQAVKGGFRITATTTPFSYHVSVNPAGSS